MHGGIEKQRGIRGVEKRTEKEQKRKLGNDNDKNRGREGRGRKDGRKVWPGSRGRQKERT